MLINVKNIVNTSVVKVQDNKIQIIVKPINEEQTIKVSSIGKPGESAYQIAVNNGFVGTEQEWIDSINPNLAVIDGGIFF